MSLFKSEDLSIDAVFNNFFVVPDYQREYVWQEKQVAQFFADIFDSFDSTDPNAEYFIGSIVTCERPDQTLELIDGQQRLTTIYLFLCVLRYRLERDGEHIQKLLGQIKSSTITSEGEESFRYRVDLQYPDSSGILQHLADGRRDTQGDQETLSGRNLLSAFDQIEEFLSAKIVNTTELKKFYAYLINSVKVIRIEAYNISRALRIFETINSRGRDLDAMDLLKNLLFMHANLKDFDDLKDIWKEIGDQIYQAGEKPLRFLRYFLIADYSADRIREDVIYQWMKDNAYSIGYEKAPLDFARKLRDAAKSYVNVLGGKTPAGSDDPALRNIQKFSGSSRQFVVLLLAMREKPSIMTTKLSRSLEDLLYAYTMVREPAREYERLFASWAPRLREIANEMELDEFIDNTIRKEFARLAPRFVLAFETCTEYSVTRAVLRYTLAKLTQWFDDEALGSAPPLDNYYGKTVEIEHIVPQKPDEASLPGHDRVCRMLGNLTLIEKPINASLGNKVFAEKKGVYAASAFWLTKLIGGQSNVGVSTSIDKAMKLVEPMNVADEVSIARRQRELGALALQVWSIPNPVLTSTKVDPVAGSVNPRSTGMDGSEDV